MTYLMIFLGGGLGSICRFGLSKILPNDDFSWATFSANFIASFILGYLISSELYKGMEGNTKLFLMTGFCGGFSTFSTFTAEVFRNFQSGNHTMAFVYITASILLCLLGLYLGFLLAKQF